MLKRIILCTGLLMLALSNLPASQAQSVSGRGSSIPISTYRDDPTVTAAVIDRIHQSKLGPGLEGREFSMFGYPVSSTEEDWIFRKDANGEFQKFAWNPWPLLHLSNENGDFSFPNEARFPLFTPERGPDGKIILRDGLQVWKPNQLYLGTTTAFEAANFVKDAGEAWAGRELKWGQNGTLNMEPHAFIDFNAFYSPSARELFFGIVPYRLPGETAVKIIETATSWEMVAHECGHALHHVLKPNTYHDIGFAVWSESFGDQVAMWASLRKSERGSALLAETHGNLNQSNSLTRMAEAFAYLIGKGTGMRDAFHDLKLSDTTEEVHDRSQVLTGATYKIFLTVYDDLKSRFSEPEALRRAGEIMGVFTMRATDYAHENEMTLENVAKAYLKVDKEFFGSRYHSALVSEFIRREIFDANSEHEWLTHEDSLPYLWLSHQSSDQDVEELLQANALLLGVGQDFGLKLQSVTREEFRGQTIVRAQLTLGRGEIGQPLDNHAILVFRADGSLADYHPALQPYPSLQSGQTDTHLQSRESIQLRSLISQAKRLRLDQHAAPLSIVRKTNGQLTMESRVLREEGLNTWMEVFTLDNPRGERREVMIPPVPPNKRISIPSDILN